MLKNTDIPARYYTGVTSNVATRHAEHNAGGCTHTAKYSPWSIDVVIEFADELLISNKGRAAVAFPTSLDGNRFRRSTPKAAGAFVNLVFEDSLLGQQVVGTQALYGAPDVVGSIVMLSPGEMLELRASGTWYPQPAFPKPPPDYWSRDLDVQASVELFSNGDPPPPLRSENKIEVRLRKH